ncbi:hypothetical protein DPEC_G00145460 [Dallia pectoralis]|uniref:Uncharacterized protein n=1 Tax=Dallia pectoralis TaxID=75939 RepID=A0ACC2GP40_DALPE|nr:hypothetical protein DPEC_G00145460 [Dallia pectoralis]
MGLLSITCLNSPLLVLLWVSSLVVIETEDQQAFKVQPRNITVRAGALLVLRCEVLRPSGTVQWVKNGLILGPQRSLPGYPRYHMVGDHERGQYHLQIKDAQLEDDGPYECQVGQSESSRAIVSHTVWINVQSEQNHWRSSGGGGVWVMLL